MEYSWLQRYALLILLRQESARVKDLTPAGVAANLFSYHLLGLVGAGIIEKSARGVYRLTAKGHKLAGTFSTSTEAKVDEIKTVIMLYGKKDSAYLLFRWSRQPYLNEVTLLHDRVPFGIPLSQAIQSATEEKLGLILPAAFRSTAVIQIWHKDKQVSHMNAYIYEVNLSGVQLPFVSRNGEAFLGDLDEVGIMYGLKELVAHIKSGAPPVDIILTY